jgi:hypothetical protein
MVSLAYDGFHTVTRCLGTFRSFISTVPASAAGRRRLVDFRPNLASWSEGHGSR